MSITSARNILLASESINSAESRASENSAPLVDATGELESLFRDHHKMVFRVAYRMTGSPSDAEDVLQTIFLRLAPRRLDLSPSPEAYLHRAAVNASLDLIRRRMRANLVAFDIVEFNHQPASGARSPEQELADAELRELIRHAVAKLEGRAAEAFALRYFDGCDNASIARILGTSQMVVAVTLHRARTRLRKEIGNYLEKHHDA